MKAEAHEEGFREVWSRGLASQGIKQMSHGARE